MKTKQIALILVALLLLSSFASAGFFGDFWDKVTGRAVTPIVGSKVATGNPIGPEAPSKLTAKGLFQVAENQIKQLSNAPMFKNNKEAQAALKRIAGDLNQLKTLTATEKAALKPTPKPALKPTPKPVSKSMATTGTSAS